MLGVLEGKNGVRLNDTAITISPLERNRATVRKRERGNDYRDDEANDINNGEPTTIQ